MSVQQRNLFGMAVAIYRHWKLAVINCICLLNPDTSVNSGVEPNNPFSVGSLTNCSSSWDQES